MHGSDMSDNGVGLWDAAQCGWACMGQICQTMVFDCGMLPTGWVGMGQICQTMVLDCGMLPTVDGSDMSGHGAGLWDAAQCGWACMGQICPTMVFDCGMLPTVDGPAWV